ncbi:hypothetical protein CDD83_10923 [Cordyceps sp. RAO-2017]|nr:hypothetical protein CDD83_10923 [Cordyceps sp. RAO-2017]
MTSLRSLTLPTHQDGRLHRDDEPLASRAGTPARPSRPGPPDGASAPQDPPVQDGVVPPAFAAPIQRRNLVFPDPIAFRFLEEDSCVEVVERRSVLRGYELYIVEQWACSRKSPTLVIATYTGDETHTIAVGVLAVPEDETLWSARLRVYLKAAQQHHARPKKTELGELLVTNLSSFPSALSVISVPDGDVHEHRSLFIVNEDLKRLGCSGRSGLTLTEPTEATQAKFQQLYRTSDRIPFLQSVTELIKLCQVALYMFEKLDQEYIDGLLCDVTETAVGDWWIEIGVEHYNFEPTDGILGPSTVAALLGMLMGARNRLHCCGAPVPKDVFDIEGTRRGVYQFQKQQKLNKTRRLDRQTLFRLHTATAKAVSGEGWGVQKAVKSTVSEIGGKRGEIVMDMVSGKDKGGIADIETLDMDRFVSLAYGERPKWLWHGKPRRTPAELADHHPDLNSTVLAKTEAGGQSTKRTQSLPLEDETEWRKREDGPASSSSFPLGPGGAVADSAGERDALRRNVFKSVAGKMSDARSGLGRIKDAVGGGRRGHAARSSITSRDDFAETGGPITSVSSCVPPSSTTSSSPAVAGRAFSWKNRPEDYVAGIRQGDADVLPRLSDEPHDAGLLMAEARFGKRPTEERSNRLDVDSTLDNIGAEVRKDVVPRALLRSRPVADEKELQGPILDAVRNSSGRQLMMSRRHSCGVSDLCHREALNENRWARRMSFGDAEPAILTWTEIVDMTDATGDVECFEARAEEAGHLGRLISGIVHHVEPWVEEKLRAVGGLDERYARDSAELEHLYRQLGEACQRVRHSSDELLAAERSGLGEAVKEVELLLARLEYEIGGLVQKVNDVEDGVLDFERQVAEVERRAEELKVQLETESWLHWFVRTLTGVGTGPNITRAAP